MAKHPKLPEPLSDVDRHFTTPRQWAVFLRVPEPEKVVGIQITKEDYGGIIADCMVYKERIGGKGEVNLVRYDSINGEWVKQ